MNTRTHVRRRRSWLVLLPVLLGPNLCWGQPKPGDIFQEFTFNYGKTRKTQFSELDPNCPRKKDPAFDMRDKPHRVPKNIEIDLDKAVRAEMSVGVVHNYSFDAIDVPLDLLHQGDNSFYIYSGTTEHAAEVNWPGPVLLVEFKKR